MNISKKTLKISVVIFTAVIATVIVWLYFTTGKVTITTPTADTAITITTPSGKTVATASGHMTKSLHMGRYVVVVASKSFGAQKSITIHWNQSITQAFKSSGVHDTEPVIGGEIQDLAVGNDKIMYLSPKTSNIMQINNQNSLSIVDESRAISNVYWSDASYGVARDEYGNLFEISNGKVTALELPSTIKLSPDIVYSVNKDHGIFLSVNGVVYYGSSVNNLKQIYKIGDLSSLSLVSTNDTSVVFSTKTSASGGATITGNLKTIDKNGKVLGSTTMSLDEGAFTTNNFFSWSPDGNRLAVLNGGSVAAIYDKHLNKIVDLPFKDGLNPFWTDDSTLFFSQQNTLWRYDVRQNYASLYSNLDASSDIRSLSSDVSTDYVYMIVESDSGTSLERVGLKQQNTSSEAIALSVALPSSSDSGCNVNYINFIGQVNIIIDSTTPAQDGDCENYTSSLLSGYIDSYDSIPKQHTSLYNHDYYE